jgi:hypothetical protein
VRRSGLAERRTVVVPPKKRVVSAAAAPFVPTDIAGLVAWFDMQDAANYTEAGGFITSINNKVSLEAWAEGTVPPAYQATGLNSLPAMDFDGTQRIISTEAAVVAALSTGQSYTLLIACQVDVADSAYAIFGAGRDDQATDHARYMGTLTTGSGVWISALRTGASTQNIASTGTPVTTAVVYENYQSTVVGSIQINGAAADPDGASQITGTLTPNRCALGCRPVSTPNVLLNGRIGELLLYDSLLDATNRGLARSYLGTKWAITVA